jgi:hypothetical protein
LKRSNRANVVDFPIPYIEVERTPEFFEAAKELSDFIRGLPLSHADNDKLIELIIKNINLAETGAFMKGLEMGG